LHGEGVAGVVADDERARIEPACDSLDRLEIDVFESIRGGDIHVIGLAGGLRRE
jgi:hypothetical protein